MSKCARCGIIYLISPYDHFCTDCGNWLDERLTATYNERRVVGLSELVSRVVFGERDEAEKAWRCW